MNIPNNHSMKTKSCTQGFTLVELLVVISIIGIMSGMFVVAYRGAQQESNSQKTRSTVQKISDVITSRMQDYETYNVPISIPSTAVPLNQGAGFPDRARLVERAKLLLLREIIRTEMPDHPDDLKVARGKNYGTTTVVHPNFTGLVVPNPSGSPVEVYVPAMGLTPGALTSRAANLYSRLSTSDTWSLEYANAELLYLIVEDSELDGSSALELFGSNEIGDTDNDGFNEFLDAFGRPIYWIRWPSGYAQVGRSYPDMLDPNIIDSDGNLTVDSDPYDRVKSDPGWFASNGALKPEMYPRPLIVSAGLDGRFGLNFREHDPARSGGLSPRWPAGIISYSVGDLPFPEQVLGRTLRFADPWGPRLDPSMRMGSYLVPGADPREGGANAQVSNPIEVASDNITNYEGATASL